MAAVADKLNMALSSGATNDSATSAALPALPRETFISPGLQFSGTVFNLRQGRCIAPLSFWTQSALSWNERVVSFQPGFLALQFEHPRLFDLGLDLLHAGLSMRMLRSIV
jgi:hypothetical protein